MAFSNMRNQKATWWHRNGVDSAGDPTWDSPQRIWVRWEEKREIIHSSNGEELQGDAVIWTDKAVAEGDMFYLGLSIAADPNNLAGTKRALGFNKTPSVDSKRFEIRVVAA